MLNITKYKKLSDEELLPLINKGVEAAFNEIYFRYGKRMYGFFYRMLGNNVSVANDLCQELFMKLVEKNHLFEAERSFETWFFAIARNLCKNEYRRQDRLQKNMAEWQQSKNEVHEKSLEKAVAGNLDGVLFNQHLNRALEALDFSARICFVLRYQEDLSLKEISKVVDCPVGTVKSRLYYTLKKLAGELEVYNLAPGP